LGKKVGLGISDVRTYWNQFPDPFLFMGLQFCLDRPPGRGAIFRLYLDEDTGGDLLEIGLDLAVGPAALAYVYRSLESAQ
jgi:hypothetical protein